MPKKNAFFFFMLHRKEEIIRSGIKLTRGLAEVATLIDSEWKVREESFQETYFILRLSELIATLVFFRDFANIYFTFSLFSFFSPRKCPLIKKRSTNRWRTTTTRQKKWAKLKVNNRKRSRGRSAYRRDTDIHLYHQPALHKCKLIY